MSHFCWAWGSFAFPGVSRFSLCGVSQDFMVHPWAPLLWLWASPVPSPVPASPPTPLTRMIDWVSWPLGKNIDKWIIALLKGLAAVKKFSILIEVSLAKIEKVGGPCLNLDLWPFPLVSSGCSAGVGCRVLGVTV